MALKSCELCGQALSDVLLLCGAPWCYLYCVAIPWYLCRFSIRKTSLQSENVPSVYRRYVMFSSSVQIITNGFVSIPACSVIFISIAVTIPALNYHVYSQRDIKSLFPRIYADFSGKALLCQNSKDTLQQNKKDYFLAMF